MRFLWSTFQFFSLCVISSCLLFMRLSEWRFQLLSAHIHLKVMKIKECGMRSVWKLIILKHFFKIKCVSVCKNKNLILMTYRAIFFNHAKKNYWKKSSMPWFEKLVVAYQITFNLKNAAKTLNFTIFLKIILKLIKISSIIDFKNIKNQQMIYFKQSTCQNIFLCFWKMNFYALKFHQSRHACSHLLIFYSIDYNLHRERWKSNNVRAITWN